MDVVHSALKRVDYDLRVMSWHDAEHSPLDLGRIDLIARLRIHTSTWIRAFFPLTVTDLWIFHSVTDRPGEWSVLPDDKDLETTEFLS